MEECAAPRAKLSKFIRLASAVQPCWPTVDNEKRFLYVRRGSSD